MSTYEETYNKILSKEVREITTDRFGNVTWHLDDVEIRWGKSYQQEAYESFICWLENLLGIRIYK